MKIFGLKRFVRNEHNKLKEMNKVVKKYMDNEMLITEHLHESDTEESFGARIADHVAEFGGSWSFIISFGAFLFIWIVLNFFVLVNKGFDPYPFILLNLILSCLAAIQAPVILMSQNRKEIMDRKRSENDYLINLKAEMQVRSLHEKFDMLMSEHMKKLFEVQQKQLETLKRIEKSEKKTEKSRIIQRKLIKKKGTN